MTEAVVIELETPILREVDAMALQLGQTREAFMQDVFRRLTADHSEQIAMIDAGIAQLDRGEGVSQDEMERLAAAYRAAS